MVQDLKIEALSAPPAYQVVSREIRKLILSGSLQPGEPFPSELSLAEKLGVNRSTVREGIRQLEADGLVRRSGRRRLFVSIPDTSQIAPRATDRGLPQHHGHDLPQLMTAHRRKGRPPP